MDVVGIDDEVTIARRRIFGFAGQLSFGLSIFVDHLALVNEPGWHSPEFVGNRDEDAR